MALTGKLVAFQDSSCKECKVEGLENKRPISSGSMIILHFCSDLPRWVTILDEKKAGFSVTRC